jgi:predicted transcriptional regulator
VFSPNRIVCYYHPVPNPIDLIHMVERIEWMSPIHYEILGFFDEHDVWISAAALSKNIDYDRNYITRAAPDLVEAGLLQKDGTVYALTDLGRKFLQSEIDAKDIEEKMDS